MDIEQILKSRLIEAIKKSLNPCPLIGEKWFKFRPGGNPAHMIFIGVAKLSKASKCRPERLSNTIVDKFNRDGINVSIWAKGDGTILVKVADA